MRETKGQTLVHCPQCGENKVKNHAPAIFQVLMLVGVLMCFTIEGIPFGIAFIIGAIISKKSKARLKFTCQECKHSFKVQEQVYEEYSQYLKAN
ncbi:hypothetical protein M4D56_01800 [Cytobacillus oceanisediminis]|uniref:hypothetical protein n=1 Tax=Cytobacillus oceanisediminis TaxID=665099 RepID=UPI00203A61F8|nr:hypothetical protein [Cytobacillus oceanisediminis]MCM3527828.1 hypothetical protein [Cytobacillus oceanisediminis]